jgi:hypothetical protein
MSRVIASCTRSLGPLPGELRAVAGTGRAGDLVIARITRIGAYPRTENTHGREVLVRPGDEIVGVLGDRHSSTSIYGGLPPDGLAVTPGAPADLLAVGGVIGTAASSPASLGAPTRLELAGLAAPAGGEPLRIRPALSAARPAVPLVLVGGTAAEVGKTTFAAALVHHLTHRHGLAVGVTKLAGTGRMRDLLTMADAGARCAADFVDAGLPTTYSVPPSTVTGVARHLIADLARDGARLIVAELGGDLWGAGIPAILADDAVSAMACCLVLVPSDTMASLGAATWVRSSGIAIPTVHGVPFRNVVAARQRLLDGLGVRPVDPQDAVDLDRVYDELIHPALAGAIQPAELT